MDTSPNPSALAVALHVLTEQMRHLLHKPPTSVDDQTLLLLARELERLTEQVLWCRDAALALARQSSYPISWAQLEHATQVPDATLTSRLQRWRHREAASTRARDDNRPEVTS